MISIVSKWKTVLAVNSLTSRASLSWLISATLPGVCTESDGAGDMAVKERGIALTATFAPCFRSAIYGLIMGDMFQIF